MAAPPNWFDPLLVPSRWLDDEATAQSWFDAEYRPSGNLTAHALANAQAFGTVGLRARLAPSAVANGQSLGTPTVRARISPYSFLNATEPIDTFERRLNFSGYTSPGDISVADRWAILGAAKPSETTVGVGVPTVTPESPSIAVAGFANAQSFGAFALRASLAVSGFTNAQTFGSVRVSGVLSPAGIANAASVGVPAVRASIAPVGLSNTALIGTVALRGVIALASLAGGQSFGTVHLSAKLTVAGLANDQTFGTIAFGWQPIELRGFDNASTFGTAGVGAGVVAVGFANASTCGTVGVRAVVAPSGFANTNEIPGVAVSAQIATVGFLNNWVPPVVVQVPGGISGGDFFVDNIPLSKPPTPKPEPEPPPVEDHALGPYGVRNRSEFGVTRVKTRLVPKRVAAPRFVLASFRSVSKIGAPTVSRRRRFAGSPRGPTATVVSQLAQRSAPRRPTLGCDSSRNVVDCARTTERGTR